MFTEKDLKLFAKKQISIERANWQIEQFIKGVIPINLIRPATISEGIEQINDPQYYINIYEKASVKITKFVPASGAASRMFKSLFEFSERLKDHQLSDLQNFPEVEMFFDQIERFAFFYELNALLEQDGGIKEILKRKNYKIILDKLLTSKGLAYGDLPKGLLSFHKYKQGTPRTPFEEHLVEGANYAISSNRCVNLHFTISPEHAEAFMALKDKCIKNLSDNYNVEYNITFSVQKPSTDTMAVTSDNKPFYDSDGTILFRPGGHGALIENLNEIDSDLIFIKNIDNVVPENKLETTIRYKKALAGFLYKTQQDVFLLINKLKNKPDKKTLDEARTLLISKFNLQGKCTDSDLPEKDQINELVKILDRPIRVCGMVKNLGEPGGGPFITENENGCLSSQIIEYSQIDENDSEQVIIFSNSTHFNPVDIVCAVKNYKGEKFDLTGYVDPNTCFISKKSKGGKEIKALELPGLWNGAMAKWNTLFVEVPSETFNPVKTVNDLLRDSHQ